MGIFKQLFQESATIDQAINTLKKAGKQDKIDDFIELTKGVKSGGHMPKLVKFFLGKKNKSGEVIHEPVDFEVIKDYYQRFLKSSKLVNQPHGIEKYETFQDFEKAVDEYAGKISYNEEDNAEITDDPLYEDENIKVFRGLSKYECIKYGKGGKYGFCISRTDHANLYYGYRKNGATFYFVYFKKKSLIKSPVVDELVVIHVYPNNVIQVNFSKPNRDIQTNKDDLIEKIPSLQKPFNQGVFEFIPLSEKEKKIEIIDSVSDIRGLKTTEDRLIWLELGKELRDEMLVDEIIKNKDIWKKYIEVGSYDLTAAQKSILKNQGFGSLISRYNEKLKQRYEIKRDNNLLTKLTPDEGIIAVKEGLLDDIVRGEFEYKGNITLPWGDDIVNGRLKALYQLWAHGYFNKLREIFHLDYHFISANLDKLKDEEQKILKRLVRIINENPSGEFNLFNMQKLIYLFVDSSKIIKNISFEDFNEWLYSHEYQTKFWNLFTKYIEGLDDNTKFEYMDTYLGEEEFTNVKYIAQTISQDLFFKKYNELDNIDELIFEDDNIYLTKIDSYFDFMEQSYFGKFLGDEVSNYKDIISGESFVDYFDREIDENDVNDLYDQLILKYPEWKLRFENYIKKYDEEGYGNSLYDIITDNDDEVKDAFSSALYRGHEQGTNNAVYNAYISALNETPFIFKEIQEQTKGNNSYTSKIEIYLSKDIFYEHFTKDEEFIEELYKGESIEYALYNTGEYSETFSVPYHGFDDYDEETALEELVYRLEELDDELWEESQKLEEKYLNDNDLIWRRYLPRKKC